MSDHQQGQVNQKNSALAIKSSKAAIIHAALAELLVLSGWALDWPRYSKGKYSDEQAHARVTRLGLWAGKFTFPWEWRAQRRSGRADQPSLAN